MKRALGPLLLLVALAGLFAWWMLREPRGAEDGEAVESDVTPLDVLRPAPFEPAVDEPSILAEAPGVTASPLLRDLFPAEDPRLAGVVLRASDNKPLGGIDVQVLVDFPGMREPAGGERTSTSWKGHFEFPGEALALQPHTLLLSWPEKWALPTESWDADGADWLGRRQPAADTGSYVLPLAEAETPLDALVVRLKGWIARGRVVDGADRPIADVFVVGRSGSVTTDVDGRFTLCGPATSGRVRLYVSRTEFRVYMDKVSARKAGRTSLYWSRAEILEAGGAVREFDITAPGQVLDLGSIVLTE